jgi:hypothetical protein
MVRILLAIVIWLAPFAAASVQINPPTAFANAILAAVALPARRGRRYLRKKQVAERYNVDERTIDRMTKDGRLPPYIYLRGSKLPLQDEDELDRLDDDAKAAARQPVTESAETAV